jgi:hypothetical protein
MGFEQVVLADVKLDKPAQPGVGDYVFELLPLAEYRTNKFTGNTELNMQASVISTVDGDTKFAGRRVFWTYVDPTSVSKNTGKPNTWSAQAMKKLELSLGEDALEGEDPKTTFNRIASKGGVRFGANLVEETRKDKETGEYVPFIRAGEVEPRAVFSVFTVHAAA